MEINSYACADLRNKPLNGFAPALSAATSRQEAAMRAVVLGAAAGGGFPQWNSNAEALSSCALPAIRA